MDIETNIENNKINNIHKSRPIILYKVLCAPHTNPSKEPVCPTDIHDSTLPSDETNALIPE